MITLITPSVDNNKYVHGYGKDEQDRLLRQSKVFEPFLYHGIDFSKCQHIIEVGCGVGAQTQILLKLWPHLKITGVDISASQINRAKEVLREHIASGQVSLYNTPGGELPFPDNYFDSAIIFFVLEHADYPSQILKELHRVTRSGGTFYCTEAFNSAIYTSPNCTTFESYLEIFNQHQIDLNGDPDIGVKLYNLARKAGFSEAKLTCVPCQLDDRIQDISHREAFINCMIECFLSAAPALLKQNKISVETVAEIKQELSSLIYQQESIFSYTFMQLKAVK
jgi:SAM-dependent methyltransferase